MNTSGPEADLADSSRPGLFLMTNSFETGGSERQFVELARSLQEGSFRPRIGCIAKRGDFLGSLNLDSMKLDSLNPDSLNDVVEFPLGGNLYGPRAMQARLRLAHYLRKSRIAVTHAFDFYTNLVLIPAARLARVPVVIGSQRQLGDLLSPAKSRAQLTALRWCDRVICNSRAAAERLTERGLQASRIVVIGNGLPPSAFAPAIPSPDRDSSILRIGMIARMNARSKNHRVFLRAAATISRRFPRAEFILAGDGPLRPELEQEAAELGIGDRVRFLGDRRDIPSILASLDVSVLPSESESLSNAILESMAAGVPVVASRVGGNPELVTKDRGFLVAPSDADAFANAIEHLLQNQSLRAEFGLNGRKFAESNFTMAAVRKRHEELYCELLETKTRHRNLSHPAAAARESSPQPLHIAIIAASPRYVGGQSVQAELLVANWRNDPAVVASFVPIDPTFPRSLRWAESIPFLRTLVRQPFYLAALWQALSAADIAHIFSASYWSFLIAPAPASMLARLRGKKTIIHYHSGEARDHLLRFPGSRSLLANADGLVVPSAHLVNVFREFGLTAQEVPNIVDFSQFVFRERKPLRAHMICTRGFHPYYRVDRVVRAFAEIQRQFPRARLDLVGQGPEEHQIRQLVSQLNLNGVSFRGVASRREIGRFYDEADIFINASTLDNMPVSILEAFAAGTPVVTTSPEGMRYLVEHERTGLVSETEDESALAQSVIRLLRDPCLSSRIAWNAYHQSKCYSWTAVRQQWLDIYRSLPV